jgi:hypothetical protein
MRENLVNMADKLRMPELMEAEWITMSNNEYHIIAEKLKEDVGSVDAKIAYDEWEKWLRLKIKSGSKD